MSQPRLAEPVVPFEWQFAGFVLPTPDSTNANGDHFKFRSD